MESALSELKDPLDNISRSTGPSTLLRTRRSSKIASSAAILLTVLPLPSSSPPPASSLTLS